MRQIGILSTQQQAQRLADFLLTRGIRSQLENTQNGVGLWAIDEDSVPTARSEYARFVENPESPEYGTATAAAQKMRSEAAARDQQIRRNMVDLRSQWLRPTAARPVTWFLIGASIAVSLMTDFGDNDDRGSVLWNLTITNYGLRFGTRLEWLTSPESEIRRGEVWRLVTPIFLHFSWMHLLFNMLATHSLGGLLETRYGSLRLLLLAVVLAVVSNLAQYFWSGPEFGGMSGVAFGLFGVAWMKSRYDPLAGIHIDPGNVIMMLFYLGLCMTGYVGRIANGAHLAGLVMGMIIGLLPVLWRQLRT